MKYQRSLLLSLVLFSIPGALYSQQWTGVLSPSRAVDWSTAGISGGLPSASWTQCGSTIAAYTGTAATINTAISNCAANHYVQLGAGTFTLSTGIVGKSNVALRGMGANQTFITGSGTTSCFGLPAMVGLCSSDGTYANGPPSTVYNWTAGYSQGATSLTLSGVTGIVANQTLVMLDQCDDGYTGASCTGKSVDPGGFFVCSDQYSSTGPTGCGSEGGTNAYRPHRAQLQIVVPSSIAGNVLTIPTPGLHAPSWRSGQTPQAWIIQPIVQAGIEDLSLDATTSASNGVLIWNGYKCWVSGVRFVKTGKSAVWLFQSSHSLVQNNYIYQSQDSDPYGIQASIDSDTLIVNNIIQQNRSPIVLNGPSSGSVFAYNFTILNQAGSNGNWSFWNHSSGIAFSLWEGNNAGGFANDVIHGSHNMITRYRNRLTGHEDVNVGQINPNYDAAYNRFGNLIGNVMGTSGSQTAYQSTDVDATGIVFTVGAGNPGASPAVPTDSVTTSTMMRWGNYDVVTGKVRWCTSATSPCSGSEVPSGLASYANTVPASQTLPASFFLSSKPTWWPSAKAWPPIGPDVTGGNIASVGGYANTIPAQDCYLNTMGGPAAGTGSVLSFNAATCYPQSSTSTQSPLAPTNVVATAY